MSFYTRSKALFEADEERLRYLAQRGDPAAVSQLNRTRIRAGETTAYAQVVRKLRRELRLRPPLLRVEALHHSPPLPWACVYFDFAFEEDNAEEDLEDPERRAEAQEALDNEGVGPLRCLPEMQRLFPGLAITGDRAGGQYITVHTPDTLRRIDQTLPWEGGGRFEVLPYWIATDFRFSVFGREMREGATFDSDKWDEFLESPEPFLFPLEWSYLMRVFRDSYDYETAFAIRSEELPQPNREDLVRLQEWTHTPPLTAPEKSQLGLLVQRYYLTPEGQRLAEAIRLNIAFNTRWPQRTMMTHRETWW